MNSEGQTQNPTKSSSFEYATKLLLPALSLVAFILLELTGKQARLQWVLLGLTVLFLGIGFYPSVRAKTRRWLERAKDERAAKYAFPELRRFAHRFRKFVDNRQCDTLHYIVHSELCQGDGSRLVKLGIPDIGFFDGFSNYFAQRIDRQRPSLVELQHGLMEFQHLVGNYNNLCVATIFERLPQDFTPLKPQTQRSLNSFQQRFSRFLDDYEQFARELCESRPSLQHFPYSFVHPKPL